jgi:hypothetical protein
MAASVPISTDESSAVCVDEAAVPEQSVVHSAGGGGVAMGGVSVSPANAIPARETMRVEIANSRLSFVIMLFVLFIERPLGITHPATVRGY